MAQNKNENNTIPTIGWGFGADPEEPQETPQEELQHANQKEDNTPSLEKATGPW